MFRLEDSFWWYQALHSRALDAARSCLVSRPHARILDAGCGTGGMAAQLLPLGDVTAADVSPVALRFASRRQVDGKPCFACASVEALPFDSAAFDLVVSLDVLCHGAVQDQSAALAEMSRVLSPGGHLVLNLPAYPGLLSAHDRAVLNTRRYLRTQVVQLLSGAGLGVISMGYWNSLLFPVVAALRLLRRRPGEGETSDLTPPREWLNRLLKSVISVERSASRVLAPPFGLSIFAIAQKPGSCEL